MDDLIRRRDLYKDKRISVVIPAYNEERLIGKTLCGIPEFVDDIIVVDDQSKDNTSSIINEFAEKDPRIVNIRHEENKGVGGAISTGYIWCRDSGTDIAVVMAGDNQMDPNDMPALLDPVVEGKCNYSKGNRLVTGEAWEMIPRLRYLGNAMLSFLTKIASGYWHVADSQTGYTAIDKKALELIPLEQIYPRYGMPNDLLVTLNIYNMGVVDVPVRPVYADEESGIKIRKVLFTLSFLLLKLFVRRMVQKYIIRDFHPLVLFYLLGIFFLGLGTFFFGRSVIVWIVRGDIPPISFLSFLFCGISGLQLVLFAMLFDMQDNRHLSGN